MGVRIARAHAPFDTFPSNGTTKKEILNVNFTICMIRYLYEVAVSHVAPNDNKGGSSRRSWKRYSAITVIETAKLVEHDNKHGIDAGNDSVKVTRRHTLDASRSG